MSKQISGLNLNKVDDSTGVPTEFHTVVGLSFDYSYNSYTVTIGSWYNQSAFSSGKRAVNSVQLTLGGSPPRGVDPIDWVLSSIAAVSNEKSPFAGANLVEKEI
nr:MAG TPA: hypothetical protein [Bacteriophage sp.]